MEKGRVARELYVFVPRVGDPEAMLKPQLKRARRHGRKDAEELRSRIGEKFAVAELASQLAHELNNPLEALTNLIYLARRQAPDDEMQQMLEHAEAQVARISAVVHSIVTLQNSNHEQRLRTAGRLLGAEALRRMKDEYESALRLASIVEGAQDAIYSKKLDGTIMAWNREAEHLFGYSAAEALGCSVRMLIPNHLSYEEWQILEKVKAGNRVAAFETVRRTKDGRDIRVSVSISPIRNPNGRIVGASTIAREVMPEPASQEIQQD
jgi:PAS domain S-box-containing protein